MSRPKANPEGKPRKSKDVQVLSAVPVVDEDDPVVPELPPFLAEVGELWIRTWTNGIRTGLLDRRFDLELVSDYCEIRMEIARLRQELGGKFVTKGSQQQMVLHPKRRELKELRNQALARERLLAKTPEDRIRLGLAAGGGSDDPFDDFDEEWED